MKIVQIIGYLSYGDGIGNTIVEMDRVLSSHYNTQIAVNKCSSEYSNHPRVIIFQNIRELDIQPEDIVILHYGGEDPIAHDLMGVECKRILLYQNVTYPFFYAGIDNSTTVYCAEGQRYVRNIVGLFLKVIAPSWFSYNELIDMGWKKEDVYHLPLPVSLHKKEIEKKETGAKRQFLFVGRTVPNKKIEDVIRVFDYYRKNYYENSVLRLAGSFVDDAYTAALLRYIEEKKIRNVDFLGRVTNEELEELYKTSDLYLCMSEHEGFCMPLLEAMSYQIPVMAYSSTAVPDTMGDAGILLESKDSIDVCNKIDKLFSDLKYRLEIIDKQNQHLDSFIRNDYEKRLFNIIENVDGISSYEYDSSSFAFYRIQIREIEEYAKKDLHAQMQRIIGNGKPIITYGVGKVGLEFIQVLNSLDISIGAICDSNKYGQIIGNRKVLTPQKCVDKYSGGIYIITVQNRKAAMEIYDSLCGLGVTKQNIVFYSNRDKRIYV